MEVDRTTIVNNGSRTIISTNRRNNRTFCENKFPKLFLREFQANARSVGASARNNGKFPLKAGEDKENPAKLDPLVSKED